MRSLASLLAAAVIACQLVACVADVEVTYDEPDDPVDESAGDPAAEDPADVVTVPLAATGPGQLRVVQMNPYYAGRFEPYTENAGSCTATSDCGDAGLRVCTATDQSGCYECIDHRCRNRNWATMTNAAGLFADISADLVGIEELDPRFAPKIDQILEAKTGHAWSYIVSPQGIDGKGSGIGAYWRPDRIELVADLGYTTVDTLSTRYLVRFRGVILKDKASQKQFGFFSGKLVWGGGGGGDGDDRTAEAGRLRAWMDQQMAKYPAAKARILASDFNDTVGSDAYDVFASYDDGDAGKPTAPAAFPLFSIPKRIDYLFWTDRSSGASQDGFVTARSDGRLGRSQFFGSDHRFVYGDAKIP